MAGLKTAKRRRLLVVSVALFSLIGASLLVVFALGRDSLSLFLQPSSALERGLDDGVAFRLGGLVAADSVVKLDDGLTNRFTVTDCAADIVVEYRGLLPDLFREGQGVVTDGAFQARGPARVFVASSVLAKHDETYAPPGTLPTETGACEHPDAASAIPAASDASAAGVG